MKKILSMVTCSVLAACACNDANWEDVDGVTFEEVVYEDNAPVVVEPAPVYVQVPQAVQDCPCADVATPCYQPCACQPMPKVEPKIIKTKKIITTTTTYEEPCGKPVCEPVVTIHEEFVPVEDGNATTISTSAPVMVEPVIEVKEEVVEPQVVVPAIEVKQETPSPVENAVKVTVEKSPYHSKNMHKLGLPNLTNTNYAYILHNILINLRVFSVFRKKTWKILTLTIRRNL